MSFSVLQIILGLLLLVVPAALVVLFDLRRMRLLLLVVLRVALVSSVTAGAIWAIGQTESGWVNAFVSLLLVPVGTWLTVHHARLSLKTFFVPLLAGSFVSLLLVGSYCYFAVLGQRSMSSFTVLLPLSALLVGSSVGMLANGLRAYYLGLRHHNELYLYLLGNGSTHREALQHMVRRGFQASMQTVLRQFSGFSLLTVPVVTLIMLMAGADVVTAVAMQVLWIIATLAYTMLAMLVALIVARKHGFDPYRRLKN